MNDAKQKFCAQLKKAMENARLEPIPSVLEREFNQRYMGTGMTLHGVRRWLEGEVLPSRNKLELLENWLKVDFVQFRPAAASGGKSSGVKERAAEWQAGIPAHEKEIVQTFLELPMQQRKIIREVILAFAKK